MNVIPVRTDEDLQDMLKSEGIKKIVWEGALQETDEGRNVRGSVGRTDTGSFRAAEVSIYHEYGRNNRVLYSVENYQWDDKQFAQKEQAIFAARSKVEYTKNHDSHVSESEHSAIRGSAVATKYGKHKTLGERVSEIFRDERKSR